MREMTVLGMAARLAAMLLILSAFVACDAEDSGGGPSLINASDSSGGSSDISSDPIKIDTSTSDTAQTPGWQEDQHG